MAEIIYQYGIVLILGLGFGSYATMAVDRLPKGKPWIGDVTRCHLCQATLGIRDYFSILSYFYTNGRCRHCDGQFEASRAYLFTETLITVGFLLGYWQLGWGEEFFLAMALVIAATVGIVIKGSGYRLPGKIISSLLLFSMLAGTLRHGSIMPPVFAGLAGLAIGVVARVVFYLIKQRHDIAFDFTDIHQKERLGGVHFEDVILLGCLLPLVPFIHWPLYGACVLASVVAATLSPWKRQLPLASWIMFWAVVISIYYQAGP